jgi:predicted DNA-binding mobile mystery protein A
MDPTELVRRQLDARLGGLPREQAPRDGWTRTVRLALGMTMAQLGRRLGVTAPAIADLEHREARGAITVAKLRGAADALGCDLLVAFVPRVPLNEMVRQQALIKIEEEHRRLLHTMALEDQSQGVESHTSSDAAVERWVTQHHARLWE